MNDDEHQKEMEEWELLTQCDWQALAAADPEYAKFLDEMENDHAE